MGFLDRAKKLAEQAKELAEQATKAAEGALGEARARSGGSGSDDAPPPPADPRLGTSYVPGMLGRPGWREEGLADPAAVLPIADRDRAGVPHTTKSEIVEELFGMGRRWTADDGVAIGVFYRLHADHQGWEPPGGGTPFEGIEGAWQASLADGRELVFLPGPGAEVVLETDAIDDSSRSELAHAVARQLAGD